MYTFVSKKNKKLMNKKCLDIIHVIQDLLRDENLTFDIRLVGSGVTNLVTKNENKFDLDYNLIIKRDDNNLIDNPEFLRNLFVNTLNEVKVDFNIKTIHNSTSVITCLFSNDNMDISFDIAIVFEDENEKFYKLVLDKDTNNYIWNETMSMDEINSYLIWIKDNEYINEFRERYLELKNMHLTRHERINSSSVFMETLNEFINN